MTLSIGRKALSGGPVVDHYVIVPFSVACLLTGLVQSLGTVWGLLRHYWVIAKLLITVAATVLLLVHMQPVGHLADAPPGPHSPAARWRACASS